MFPKNRNRVAVIALAWMLALVLTAPAGAVGWPVSGNFPDWTTGFLPRVLTWMGLAQAPHPPHGSVRRAPVHSDLVKTTKDHGLGIDPDGNSSTVGGG
jgi:hypothetical protein